MWLDDPHDGGFFRTPSFHPCHGYDCKLYEEESKRNSHHSSTATLSIETAVFVGIVISFYAAVIFILMIISSESRSESRQRNTMRLRQPLQNTCASRNPKDGRITVDKMTNNSVSKFKIFSWKKFGPLNHV